MHRVRSTPKHSHAIPRGNTASLLPRVRSIGQGGTTIRPANASQSSLSMSKSPVTYVSSRNSSIKNLFGMFGKSTCGGQKQATKSSQYNIPSVDAVGSLDSSNHHGHQCGGGHPHHHHHHHHHHQDGATCSHSSSSVGQSPSHHNGSQSAESGHGKEETLRQLNSYSPREQQVISSLCRIIHPQTGQDLIQSGFVTYIKSNESTGAVMVRIKLDQHFRQLKQLIETRLKDDYEVPSSSAPFENSEGSSSVPHNNKWMKSLRVTLAQTQDDPESLDPVKNPSPTVTQKISTTRVAAAQPIPASSSRQEDKASQPGSGSRGLSKVKRVVLVYSGKGGVGKSQVSANLAIALSETFADDDDDEDDGSNEKKGDGDSDNNKTATDKSSRKLRVGLFDADIYGPSLPSLMNVNALTRGLVHIDGVDITPENTSHTTQLIEEKVDNDSLIRPIMCNGIKMMSYGYVSRTKGSGHGNNEEITSAPAIMRGVMVSPLLIELLTRTNWGDLDVLVVDMPPGTSDVHITIAQQIRNASAVIVTIPSRLSYVDVIRGMHLLEQTNIPIISLVQNMSYFVAPHDPTHTRHHIFGDGNLFLNRLRVIGGGIPTVVEFPIVPSISHSVDQGIPFLYQQYRALQHLTRNIAQFTSDQLHKALPVGNSGSSANDDPSLSAEITAALHKMKSAIMQSSSDAGLASHDKIGTPITSASSSTPDAENLYRDLEQSTILSYAALAKHVNHWSHPARYKTLTHHGDHVLAYNAQSNQILIQAPLRDGESSVTKQQKKKGQHDAPDQLHTKAVLSPYTLRIHCQCAGCVHEQTGRPILDPAQVPRTVFPKKITPRGSYAIAIEWSDGHTSSIYTWNHIDAIVNGVSSSSSEGTSKASNQSPLADGSSSTKQTM